MRSPIATLAMSAVETPTLAEPGSCKVLSSGAARPAPHRSAPGSGPRPLGSASAAGLISAVKENQPMTAARCCWAATMADATGIRVPGAGPGGGREDVIRRPQSGSCAALVCWQRLLFWCWRTVHWLPLIARPQCSQIVKGLLLHHCAGRSPTSSRRLGSMPRPCW
jgi:hypothetical protein